MLITSCPLRANHTRQAALTVAPSRGKPGPKGGSTGSPFSRLAQVKLGSHLPQGVNINKMFELPPVPRFGEKIFAGDRRWLVVGFLFVEILKEKFWIFKGTLCSSSEFVISRNQKWKQKQLKQLRILRTKCSSCGFPCCFSDETRHPKNNNQTLAASDNFGA